MWGLCAKDMSFKYVTIIYAVHRRSPAICFTRNYCRISRVKNSAKIGPSFTVHCHWLGLLWSAELRRRTEILCGRFGHSCNRWSLYSWQHTYGTVARPLKLDFNVISKGKASDMIGKSKNVFEVQWHETLLLLLNYIVCKINAFLHSFKTSLRPLPAFWQIYSTNRGRFLAIKFTEFGCCLDAFVLQERDNARVESGRERVVQPHETKVELNEKLKKKHVLKGVTCATYFELVF